jgi:hypothetical protein
MLMALLLDLANIVGGFLLASGLLAQLPEVGEGIARVRTRIDPFAWIVGVVAVVAAGYWLLVHTTSGPHVFHFEVVGLAVGIALLWERLTGRIRSPDAGHPDHAETAGVALLLGILGLIAIVVGLQGLFTPDG